MIAQRPISPLLDGFSLDAPFSRHGATHCFSATETGSNEKFIVKSIKFPASGVQMDALLMTGAFPDRAAANAYYKEQARAVLNEAKTLRHMATLGGFSDFDGVQVVSGEADNGFEVFLLSPKHTSLEQILGQPDVTQLQIVNMALDVCAALSICRHAGFFYVNLKPSNIFYINQCYRIGDLGFMPLSAIDRGTLPDRYYSAYTPPELMQEGQLLNNTADIYALGLMLYQAYNGGVLPKESDVVGKLFAPPKYADYEMAEIILRACSIDPNIRWNDPEQMHLALTKYLQRNGVRTTPIVLPQLQPADVEEQQTVEEFLPEQYDEIELSVPLWDIESPSVAVTPPRNRTAPKPRFAFSRRAGMITVAVLSLVLLIVLIIGGWFILHSDRIEINKFSASGAGSSVTLTLDYDLSSSAGWIITYSAPGQEAKTIYFTGNRVEISALVPGQTYTFALSAQDGTHLSGQKEVVFTLPRE